MLPNNTILHHVKIFSNRFGLLNEVKKNIVEVINQTSTEHIIQYLSARPPGCIFCTKIPSSPRCSLFSPTTLKPRLTLSTLLSTIVSILRPCDASSIAFTNTGSDVKCDKLKLRIVSLASDWSSTGCSVVSDSATYSTWSVGGSTRTGSISFRSSVESITSSPDDTSMSNSSLARGRLLLICKINSCEYLVH